jgi:hypothetical protein
VFQQPFLRKGDVGNGCCAKRLDVLRPVGQRHRRIDAHQAHAGGGKFSQVAGVAGGRALEALQEPQDVFRLAVRAQGRKPRQEPEPLQQFAEVGDDPGS